MASDLITSPANPLLKQIRKAQQQGDLTAQGWIVAEGPRLVDEAIRSRIPIACLVATDADRVPRNASPERLVFVSERVFRSISGTETPQGILALLEVPQHSLAGIGGALDSLVVILDGVQDPGNIGAIARSAEAFGATGMVFLEGSANPWSPKALRASAGSLLRIPHVRLPRQDPKLELPVFAGVPGHGLAPWECNWKEPFALVIGSEGHGISAEFIGTAQPVRIPTRGVESLNVSVAASLLLYEAARQRSGVK